jgi:hypothetical protein
MQKSPSEHDSSRRKLGKALSFHPSVKNIDEKTLQISQSEPAVSKSEKRKSIWGLLRSASFNFREEPVQQPPTTVVQNPLYGKKLPQRRIVAPVRSLQGSVIFTKHVPTKDPPRKDIEYLKVSDKRTIRTSSNNTEETSELGSQILRATLTVHRKFRF